MAKSYRIKDGKIIVNEEIQIEDYEESTVFLQRITELEQAENEI